MGKDKDGKFHPGKGMPSGINKSEPEIPADLPARHPNRNVNKGGSNTNDIDNPANKSRNAELQSGVSTTAPEELSGILTKDIFNELAGYDQGPCVSILLPTHRSGVQVNEKYDLAAFKNALQQAEKTMKDKGVEQVVINNIMQPAYELLRDDAFWYSMTDGLALYLADGYSKYLKLRAPLVQQVFVNSSFYVNPLVPFMVRKEYFYILDIAKKFPRFYRADAHGIERLHVEELPTGVDDVVHVEEKDGNDVFRAGGKGGTGSASFHGMGVGRPDEKQNIAMYLEEVDDTIWQSHMNKENVPLLLAGQDHLLPIYRSVTDYNNIWPEALKGNHHQQSDNELYEEAIEVMRPYFEQPLQRAIEAYGNKRATALTSSMEETIIPAAYYGRVSHLFVTKGAGSIWGTFNEQDNKLEITNEETQAAEDLVDKAVIKTIQNGGEVYLLESDRMPEQGTLVAIFRY